MYFWISCLKKNIAFFRNLVSNYKNLKICAHYLRIDFSLMEIMPEWLKSTHLVQFMFILKDLAVCKFWSNMIRTHSQSRILHHHHHHHHHHHYRHQIWFNFYMLALVGQFLIKDFQAFLSSGMSLMTFLFLRSLLITLFHVFFGCALDEQLLTLRVLNY